MRFRLSLPEAIIDINQIGDLEYIRKESGALIIGAMTRENSIDESSLIQERYALLADAAKVVADSLVRNRATIGGNLAHTDPANDHPAVMVAYNATMIATGPSGQRAIAIDDF